MVVSCSQVVICTGTFLSGEIHLGTQKKFQASPESHFLSGMKRFPAGRLGDDPSIGLSASLNAAGFKLGRLQTGTPARLDRNTIDFKNMTVQMGDSVPSPFSFLHDSVDNAVRLGAIDIRCSTQPTNFAQDDQVMCYQTHTTPETHQIVRDNMHLSCHIQETRRGVLYTSYE